MDSGGTWESPAEPRYLYTGDAPQGPSGKAGARAILGLLGGHRSCLNLERRGF